jgi:cytochrome c-type biogenesis protein CcmH
MNSIYGAAGARRLACLAPALTLAAILLGVSFVQGQSSDRAKQVGAKMVCMCGCGQVLTECNHIDCPVGPVMLKKVDQRIASGDSDDLLLQSFIQEYGEQVLSEPPAHGFNLVAWIIPVIAFGAGLALVIVVIRQWRGRTPARNLAPASGPAISADALNRGRHQADRETDD